MFRNCTLCTGPRIDPTGFVHKGPTRRGDSEAQPGLPRLVCSILSDEGEGATQAPNTGQTGPTGPNMKPGPVHARQRAARPTLPPTFHEFLPQCPRTAPDLEIHGSTPAALAGATEYGESPGHASPAASRGPVSIWGPKISSAEARAGLTTPGLPVMTQYDLGSHTGQGPGVTGFSARTERAAGRSGKLRPLLPLYKSHRI